MWFKTVIQWVFFSLINLSSSSIFKDSGGVALQALCSTCWLCTPPSLSSSSINKTLLITAMWICAASFFQTTVDRHLRSWSEVNIQYYADSTLLLTYPLAYEQGNDSTFSNTLLWLTQRYQLFDHSDHFIFFLTNFCKHTVTQL